MPTSTLSSKMSSPRHGTDDLPQADRRVLQKHSEIESIDLVTYDVNGQRRGKRVAIGEIDKIYQQGFYLPYSVYALDIAGNTVERTGYGLSSGDRDALCRPIGGTLKPVEWLEPTGAQVLFEMFDDEGRPFAANPRVVLEQVLEQLRLKGLHPDVALEYEFYLIDKSAADTNEVKPPINPRTGARSASTDVYSLDDLDHHRGFIDDAIHFARSQGINAESVISEYAPGQFEINVQHCDNAISVCDDAIALKHVVRAAAARQGLCASFMAKPYAGMAGSGAHLHLSLKDVQGKNMFALAEEQPNQAMSMALAGLVETAQDFSLLFAPHLNSYRRYQGEEYAPTALDWGINDRSVALRIPRSDAENCRIEHRIAGADANPYLLMAAVLAGLVYGVEHRLVAGAPSARGHGSHICQEMSQALKLFVASDRVRSCFNASFVDLYASIKEEELNKSRSIIAPFEYDWYLHKA